MKVRLGDFFYNGGVDTQGSIRVFINEEALSQSIKMWIASSKGDMVGEPVRGGYLKSYLMKPLSEISEGEFTMDFRVGFDRDFSPELEILDLEVIPNYEERYLEINAVFFSPELNYEIQFSENLKTG